MVLTQDLASSRECENLQLDPTFATGAERFWSRHDPERREGCSSALISGVSVYSPNSKYAKTRF